MLTSSMGLSLPHPKPSSSPGALRLCSRPCIPPPTGDSVPLRTEVPRQGETMTKLRAGGCPVGSEMKGRGVGGTESNLFIYI